MLALIVSLVHTAQKRDPLLKQFQFKFMFCLKMDPKV